MTAYCERGERATGGGGEAGGETMLSSKPVKTADGKEGWEVNFAGLSERIAYVVCASP
jgi:hypothetical protein